MSGSLRYTRQTGTALIALLAVGLSVPAKAQWRRMVFSGKGESVDVAAPHPLSYFTADPFLRDDGNEFCTVCSASGKAASLEKYKIQTRVMPVGILAGHPVVDVFYYASLLTEADATRAKWKSILVEAGPGSYEEIFHLQAYYTGASMRPSRIVQSGNERILATMDPDGGNGGRCWEGYWRFDGNGPHALDLSRLEVAMQARLAAAHREARGFYPFCSHLNLSSQAVQVLDVTVRFRLEGAIAEPLSNP